MSLFSENSAWDNEPAFRQPEDSRLEEKPEEIPKPDVTYGDLEYWYRVMNDFVEYNATPPELDNVRDEIYSRLRG